MVGCNKVNKIINSLTDEIKYMIGIFHSLFSGSNVTKTIWSVGYSLICDVNPFPFKKVPANYSTDPAYILVNPKKYCKKIKKPVSIWLASSQVEIFFKSVFHSIQYQMVLVITDGDRSFPSSLAINFLEVLEDSRVLSVFVQNYDGTMVSSKLKPIPIGLDFHTINRKGGYWGETQNKAQDQEKILFNIINNLPKLKNRIIKVYADFLISDRLMYDGTSRSEIVNCIEDKQCIVTLESMKPRSELWLEKGQYAFSLSPHGNGLDCHRTWEDLLLGCIVIVKTSSLDSLYEDLPVIIVKDWNEISQEALLKWHIDMCKKYRNTKYLCKLTNEWWSKKIKDILASSYE